MKKKITDLPPYQPAPLRGARPGNAMAEWFKNSKGRLLQGHRCKSAVWGFTLIELLVVIAIMGVLATIVLVNLKSVRQRAYQVRTLEEADSMVKAIELYLMDNNYQYPADVNRGLPPGIEKYLSSSPDWPSAPWPNSFYDWDNWSPSALSYDPKQQIYQLSIRFCKLGHPETCVFPNEEWAAGFDYYSSVYWCIDGPCRAHSSMPTSHPACCLGGGCSSYAQRCGF